MLTSSSSSKYKERLARMRTVGLDYQLVAAGNANNRIRDTAAAAGAGSVDTAGRLDRVGSRCQHQTRHRSSSSSSGGSRNRHSNITEGTSTASGLWMRHRGQSGQQQQQQQQPQQLPATAATSTQLLDKQTNNSRRRSHCRPGLLNGGNGNCVGGGSSSGGFNSESSNSSVAVQNSVNSAESTDGSLDATHNSSSSSIENDIANKHAVAKGANAIVKQTTSRQTEIIDTSKLMEEGKIDVEYEDPEEQEVIEKPDRQMIDEYEKVLAFSRRLRALLNMEFKPLNHSSIETNFLMVKAHEHPTQRVNERWRNVDMGQPYDSQVRKKKLIEEFKQSLRQKKKSKKAAGASPVYPEWIRFVFRFKKTSPAKRWADFVEYKRKMRRLHRVRVPLPKPAEKYTPAFYDIWSTSVVVFAKPESNLMDMSDSVLSRLGLEARADFKFTIGCFTGDRRTGKSKIKGVPAMAEEIPSYTLCSELYKRNCLEIFVNDNRIEMFRLFPSFYTGGDGRNKERSSAADKDADKDKMGKKKTKKKKKGKKQASKNQSNLGSSSTDAETHQFLSEIDAPIGCSGHEVGDSGLDKTAEAAAVVGEAATALDVSSPVATNQNLSIHDCDLSQDSLPMITSGSSTTKSIHSDTTRK